MMSRRKINNWRPAKGQPLTELDKRILYLQNKGHLVPTRELIKTPEQIEGIRRSGVINTGVSWSMIIPATTGLSPHH